MNVNAGISKYVYMCVCVCVERGRLCALYVIRLVYCDAKIITINFSVGKRAVKVVSPIIPTTFILYILLIPCSR